MPRHPHTEKTTNSGQGEPLSSAQPLTPLSPANKAGRASLAQYEWHCLAHTSMVYTGAPLATSNQFPLIPLPRAPGLLASPAPLLSTCMCTSETALLCSPDQLQFQDPLASASEVLWNGVPHVTCYCAYCLPDPF